MPPIRRGDGTALAPKGIKEVRRGDGTVIYAPDVIADSAVARWDAQELSLNDGETVSTWPDQNGSNDLSASGNPLYETNAINGFPSVRTDGTDDVLLGSGVTTGAYTVASVAKFISASPSSPQRIFAEGEGDGYGIKGNDGEDTYVHTHFGVSDEDTSEPLTTNPFRYIARYDGSTLVVHINGTEILNVSVSYNEASDSVSVGARNSSSGLDEHADANHAEYLVWDQYQDDQTVVDIDQYLVDRWGF